MDEAGDATAPIRERLRAMLAAAMRARDGVSVAALRSALAAIDNAEAVAGPPPATPVSEGPIAGAASGLGATEAPRRALSAEAVAALVRGEIADREAAAETYERRGRTTRARQLRAEAEVLARALDES